MRTKAINHSILSIVVGSILHFYLFSLAPVNAYAVSIKDLVPLYNLTVTTSGTGTGTVTGNPAGLNCGSQCTSYYSGTTVTLAAAPDAGSTFAGWSGGGCSGTGQCMVAMNAAMAVTATFMKNCQLTVSKTGTGIGSVISNTGTLNWTGDNGNATYAYGATVNLTAVPYASADFAGWGGEGCSGTGTCTVTMDSGKAVTATFVLKGNVLKGDVNGDSQVNLADAILVLQVLSGVTPSSTIYKQADVKEDQNIGLEEAIYVLQAVAGLRPFINISIASAVPGSLLTIGVSGFDPTATLSVRLFDEKGFTVTIPVIGTSATAVNITVPPLINMATGGFEPGFVNMEVIQTLGTTTLTSNTISGFEIGSLPALTLPPGSVSANMIGFLELALTATENRLLELDTSSGGQINTVTLRIQLEAMRIQFGQLKNKIRAAIVNPGQAETVGVINGISVTLDQESLRVADRWMVAVIDGILAELQRTPMQEASPPYARSLLALPQAIGCTQEDPVLCGMEKTLTGYKTVDGSEQQTSQEYLQWVVPANRDKVADLGKKFGAATATIGAAVVIAGGSVPLSVVALLTTATVVGSIAVFGMDAAALSSRSDDKEAAKRLLEDFNGQIESVVTGVISPILGAVSEKSGILFDLAMGWKPIFEDKISAFLAQSKTFIAAEPPPTCAYTYSDWSECQSNNTQTRTVVTATPPGCVGLEWLSQSCTYTPPLEPPVLTATAGCDVAQSGIWLAWSAPSGAVSYDVYRNGNIYLSNLTNGQYTDTAVTPGTTYTYFVRAKNASGAANSNSKGAEAVTCGSQFQGSLTGTWWGSCDYYGSVGGGLFLTIYPNSSIDGGYNGDSSGTINSTISADGTYYAGNTGSISWQGTIGRLGTTLTGQGYWGDGARCSGEWSGSGTASP